MKKKLYFPKRINEPTVMGLNEQKEFEKLSKANYKRWIYPFIDDVARRLKKNPSTILDVGSGPGLLIKELSKRYPKAEIFGVDIQNSSLKLSKLNNVNNKKTKFIKGDIESLPFNDNFFDLVVCKDSFHEFKFPKRALKEIYRVVDEGGLIYIQDLRRDLPIYLIKRVENKKNLIEKLIFFSTRAAYTKNEIKKMLDSLAFSRYNISTRKVTKKDSKYEKEGIDLVQLKEAYQSRYILCLKKE